LSAPGSSMLRKARCTPAAARGRASWPAG
jgi:hypothetical protein